MGCTIGEAVVHAPREGAQSVAARALCIARVESDENSTFSGAPLVAPDAPRPRRALPRARCRHCAILLPEVLPAEGLHASSPLVQATGFAV